MSVDITGLSVAQLEQLVVDAKARIEVVKKQQLAEVRRRLEADAKAAGFDIYELFAGRAGRSTGGDTVKRSVAPKYRNPGNSSETWTGRGKQPIWLRNALASGLTLNDLLIVK